MGIERQEISEKKIHRMKDVIQVNWQFVTPSAVPFLLIDLKLKAVRFAWI
jgi:hypothetical protein